MKLVAGAIQGGDRDRHDGRRQRHATRQSARQRAHDDPFSNPGLTDLTCWVDFTAVAEAADAAGFEVAGFATQAAFLLGGGIEARLARANQAAGERERAEFAHGARQLLLPGTPDTAPPGAGGADAAKKEGEAEDPAAAIDRMLKQQK